MSNEIETLKFVNHRLEPYEHQFNARDDADFDEFLKLSGWYMLFAWPDRRGGEFAHAYITVYQFRGKECWGDGSIRPGFYRYFVEWMCSEATLAHIFCPCLADLLELMRDWLQPLLRQDAQDVISDAVFRAQEILFDSRYGVECAQEYHRAEEQARAAARARRTKQKTQ